MSIPQTAHTIKKFDEELATLRDLVLRMGGLVEEQVRRGLDALERGDAEAARAIVQRDREIDAIELRADEEIAQLLALRSPLGVDLRTVLTLSKTVTDLERIGDEAKKIARSCEQPSALAADLARQPYMDDLLQMGQLALALVQGALDALVRLDVTRAAEIKRADKQLDKAFDRTLADIISNLMAEPAGAPLAVQAIFAAKALERIGDHAKNITQYVVYLVHGRDIRHPKANADFTDD
jgi:phosphate transport system protein